MWTWELLAVDAVAGAAAGAAGWLVTKRLAKHHGGAAAAICVALVTAVITVVNLVLGPAVKDWTARRDLHATGLRLYGNERSAAVYTDAFLPIVRDPALRQRLSAAKERGPAMGRVRYDNSNQAAFAELTGNGMARLDGGELAELFAVKRALADLSPDLCASFWTGDGSSSSVTDGLKRLSESQQITWITLSIRALSAELHADSPLPRLSEVSLQEAMDDLLDSLEPERRALISPDPTGIVFTGKRACRAFLTFLDGIKNLPPDRKETLMRFMSNPNLVDDG